MNSTIYDNLHCFALSTTFPPLRQFPFSEDIRLLKREFPSTAPIPFFRRRMPSEKGNLRGGGKVVLFNKLNLNSQYSLSTTTILILTRFYSISIN